MSGTAQIFTPLINLLLYGFVLSNFLVRIKYSFLIFFLFLLFLFGGVSFDDAQESVGFFFSARSYVVLI